MSSANFSLIKVYADDHEHNKMDSRSYAYEVVW